MTDSPSLMQAFNSVGYIFQPGIVLMSVERLDNALERALLSKLRPLSKDARERLFDDRGHLSTFAAKIDVGYALSLFDDKMYSDLNIIRKIRNEFAHPKRGYSVEDMSHFSDPEISKLSTKFNGYDPTKHHFTTFLAKVAECILAISDDKADIEQANNVLAHATLHGTTTKQ